MILTFSLDEKQPCWPLNNVRVMQQSPWFLRVQQLMELSNSDKLDRIFSDIEDILIESGFDLQTFDDDDRAVYAEFTVVGRGVECQVLQNELLRSVKVQKLVLEFTDLAREIKLFIE